jgi:hypothetical protein
MRHAQCPASGALRSSNATTVILVLLTRTRRSDFGNHTTRHLFIEQSITRTNRGDDVNTDTSGAAGSARHTFTRSFVHSIDFGIFTVNNVNNVYWQSFRVAPDR